MSPCVARGSRASPSPSAKVVGTLTHQRPKRSMIMPPGKKSSSSKPIEIAKSRLTVCAGSPLASPSGMIVCRDVRSIMRAKQPTPTVSRNADAAPAHGRMRTLAVLGHPLGPIGRRSAGSIMVTPATRLMQAAKMNALRISPPLISAETARGPMK